MPLRYKIILLLVLGALLPSVLLLVWAGVSTRATARVAQHAATTAVVGEALAKNLVTLKDHTMAAKDRLKSLEDELGIFSALAAHEGMGQTVPTWQGGSPPVREYAPAGVQASAMSKSAATALAGLIHSAFPSLGPAHVVVVAKNGITWVYPATSAMAPVADFRSVSSLYGLGTPQRDGRGLLEWSAVHTGLFAAGQVLTAVKPVTGPGGQFLGVAAVEVPLSSMVKGDAGQGIGAALVSSDGRILQSQGTGPLQGLQALSGGPTLSMLKQEVAYGVSGYFEGTIGKNPYLIAYEPLANGQLSLVSVLPAGQVESYAQNVARAVSQTAYIGLRRWLVIWALLTLALLIFAILLAQRLSRRLRAMGEGAREFAIDMKARLPEEGSDELSLMAREFNQMAGNIERLTGHLHEEVAERTAALDRHAQELGRVNALGRELLEQRDSRWMIERTLKTLEEMGYREPRLTRSPDPDESAAPVPGVDEHSFLAVKGREGQDILPVVAAQLTAALENRRRFALERARREEAQTEAVADERSRMAREIHDTLAQNFLGVILHLRDLSPGDAEARQHVQKALLLASAGLEEARRSLLDLKPALLDGRSTSEVLIDTAERWADLWGIPVDLDIAPLKLDTEAGFALLRVMQEALENVRKHSGAGRVAIALKDEEGAFVLSIEDDGAGLPAESVGGEGHGLSFMNERMHKVGGALAVTSPSSGVRIEARLPKGVHREQGQDIDSDR